MHNFFSCVIELISDIILLFPLDLKLQKTSIFNKISHFYHHSNGKHMKTLHKKKLYYLY